MTSGMTSFLVYPTPIGMPMAGMSTAARPPRSTRASGGSHFAIARQSERTSTRIAEVSVTMQNLHHTSNRNWSDRSHDATTAPTVLTTMSAERTLEPRRRASRPIAVNPRRPYAGVGIPKSDAKLDWRSRPQPLPSAQKTGAGRA